MSRHWGLLSVPSGNFLDWYDSEAEARQDLVRIVLREPESVRTLAVVAFDDAGDPADDDPITAAVTHLQGGALAVHTVPISAAAS